MRLIDEVTLKSCRHLVARGLKSLTYFSTTICLTGKSLTSLKMRFI